MENYINIKDQKIMLTDEQVEAIVAALKELAVVAGPKKLLSEFNPGAVVKIGGIEMVVLEQMDGETALICKGLFGKESAFNAENNRYDDSFVDCICETFADQIAAVVGRENIVEHNVDLTTLDGLKDYGFVSRRASLLNLNRYRQYVDILDQHKPADWWWLATATSTKRHENDRWALCVSPSGFVSDFDYYNVRGVRPFCILKSDIFVSFEE